MFTVDVKQQYNDNNNNSRTGGQTMVYLFNTSINLVDREIFRAKIGGFGKGDKRS